MSITMSDFTGGNTIESYCLFPGYTTKSATTFVSNTLITCDTPALIEGVTNVTSYDSFAVITASLEVIGQDASYFQFIYYKNLLVTGIEPSNAFVPTTSTGYTVRVNG